MVFDCSSFVGGIYDLRSVSLADNTKIRSPQTMGVEVPEPCKSAVHFMFVDSSQTVGGEDFEDTDPFPNGPRHWCQLESGCAVGLCTEGL